MKCNQLKPLENNQGQVRPKDIRSEDLSFNQLSLSP